MNGAMWARSLTPLGWAVVLMAVLILGLGLARGLGLSWDPLGLGAKRLERAETGAERGRAEALARHLETVAQEEQSQQRGQAQRRLRQVDQATTQSRTEARRAEDAETPLAADRLDRLRAHDLQLCDQTRPLAGCPAATGHPAGGYPAV